MKPNYIIDKKSDTEFEIHKFLFGGKEATYRITRKDDKVFCNCMSGIYRKYCKHKSWVSLIEKGQRLPEDVEICKEVTKEDMMDLLKE